MSTTETLRVYVSGPMSGVENYNFPAFHAASEDLRGMGHTVYSPAEMDEAAGVEPAADGKLPDPGDYAGFLARDIEVIAKERIEAIVLLPGWENSGGAKTEVAFGRALGLKILRYPELSEVPDTNVKTTEVRVTNEATGGEKGQKLARMDLLPYDSLLAISEVFGFGATKYKDRNWERGFDWGLSFGAAQRHLAAFWSGEETDPESGLPHLAHAGFHVLALLRFAQQFPELDDRRFREAA